MAGSSYAPTNARPPPDQDNDAAPLAQTPGTRANYLTKLFNDALAHTLKTCSYDNFKSCFPTPAAKRPDVLQSVWTQIVGKIQTKAKTEFEGIMMERDVVRGLNGLEGLIEEARARRDTGGMEKPIAPHTLPPMDLYNAHLAPELEPIAKELEQKIEGLGRENEKFADQIRQQRAEIEALVRGLESAVKDIENANRVMGEGIKAQAQGSAGGLKAEVLEMNQELKSVDSKL